MTLLTLAFSLAFAADVPARPAPCEALLVAERLQSAVVGDARSFDVVEKQVAPLLRHVATFLHAHGASSALTEWNELAEEGARVHDEIMARLARVRELRGRTPSRWWWPRGTTDLDVVVTDIRILHHTLLRLAEDLGARTPAIERIAEETREVRDAAVRTIAALEDVYARLATTDGELARRLGVLTDDVRMQMQLVENLDVLLAQRTQLNHLAAERARRLLEVILPMEAVLGGAALDVSPLAPRELAARPAAPRGEVVGGELPVPIPAVVTMAKRADTWAGEAKVMSRFIRDNAAVLSPNQILQLAGGLHHGYKMDVGPLVTYVELRFAELAAEDVGRLTGVLTPSDGSDMILAFVRKAQATLTNADLGRLASHCSTEACMTGVTRLMAGRR